MHLVSVHTAGSGQLEPSQSCAWSGGTSTFQAGVPIKLKSPHLELWSGGTSTLHACLPVKLKSGGFTLAQPSCTCCPAVNCDCCWVMLSPCLAFFSSRVPQFWHWYYDAYMTQTAHQWMVRVLRPNIPVCMWHVETKYRHLLQILYLSQYQCINWGTLLSCHCSVKLSRQWATQRGLGAADLLELELFHSMSVFSSP